MRKDDWKLKKSLIWNHIVLGTMNKDEAVLEKASKDLENLVLSEIEKAEDRVAGLYTHSKDKWSNPPTVISYGRKNGSNMLIRATLKSDNQELICKVRDYMDKLVEDLKLQKDK